MHVRVYRNESEEETQREEGTAVPGRNGRRGQAQQAHGGHGGDQDRLGAAQTVGQPAAEDLRGAETVVEGGQHAALRLLVPIAHRSRRRRRRLTGVVDVVVGRRRRSAGVGGWNAADHADQGEAQVQTHQEEGQRGHQAQQRQVQTARAQHGRAGCVPGNKPSFLCPCAAVVAVYVVSDTCTTNFDRL